MSEPDHIHRMLDAYPRPLSPGYEAAAFLLRHSSIEVAGKYCDDKTERIDFDQLQRLRLSQGERIIVAAAMSMFNGFGIVDLAAAIQHLDDRHYAALVAALMIRRADCFTTNLLADVQ